MLESTAQPQHQPSPRTIGDTLMAARIAGHRAHCADCRQRAEAAEARYAEYGASIQRRDRRTLGLHRTTAVTS